MQPLRPVAPSVASLAMLILLAACGTGTVTSTPAAAASDAPSAPAEESPSASPGPSGPAVVELDIPMVGRATEAVDVHALPSTESPILTGESFTDPDARPEIRLTAGTLVLVTLGPVVSEGESWYEIASTDGGDTNFAGGWVPGRLLEREAAMPEGFSPIHIISGQGTGDSVTIDVDVGSPISMRYAGVPIAEGEDCELSRTVTLPDGSTLDYKDTVDTAFVATQGPQDVEELFTNTAGSVTLEVETDCAFAASLTAP